MTFKTNSGVYGSIHEAALYDFPEMTLQRREGTSFKSNLAPWPDGVKVKKPNHFTTAWRTLQIGDKAVDLINSGLILNLNPPCQLETTDWIEPMKYVGVWWGMHVGVETWTMGDRHGATTENAKNILTLHLKMASGVFCLKVGMMVGRIGAVINVLNIRNLLQISI